MLSFTVKERRLLGNLRSFSIPAPKPDAGSPYCCANSGGIDSADYWAVLNINNGRLRG